MPGLLSKIFNYKPSRVEVMTAVKGSTSLIHAQLGIKIQKPVTALPQSRAGVPSVYADIKTHFVQPRASAIPGKATLVIANAAIQAQKAEVIQKKRVANGLVTDTGNKVTYQRQDLNDREINIGAALGRVTSSRAAKDKMGLMKLTELRVKEGRWSKLVTINGTDKQSQQQMSNSLNQLGIHTQGKALQLEGRRPYQAVPTPFKWLGVYSPKENTHIPGNFRPKM